MPVISLEALQEYGKRIALHAQLALEVRAPNAQLPTL